MKKLITFLSIIAIVAAIAACEKKVPDFVPQKQDQGQQKDKDKDKDKDKEPKQPEPLSKDFISAGKVIAEMGAGWNLGNTLDANSGDTTNMWIECWGPHGIEDYEKAWGQVPATRELFQMMREAGFRTIRVPVTWYPHMGTDFDFTGHQPVWYPSVNPLGYTVDEDWMARVKQVVDDVLAEDMYCIINVHHDTGTANTHWLVASEENYAVSKDRFTGLWKQIATTFKDYDNRLMFEGYNEMTDDADSWCFASFGTPGNYDEGMATSAYNAINSYAQDFVKTVRESGGNNDKRNLIVNTYAACSGDGNWNSHLKDPLIRMKLPEDPATDHLMLQVHYYPSFKANDDYEGSVKTFIKNLDENLASKGAPVIIGEWGVSDTSEIRYDKNHSKFIEFAEFFVKTAKAHNMATIYWMGITDGSDRAVPKFTQPELKDAIIKGAQ